MQTWNPAIKDGDFTSASVRITIGIAAILKEFRLELEELVDVIADYFAGKKNSDSESMPDEHNGKSKFAKFISIIRTVKCTATLTVTVCLHFSSIHFMLHISCHTALLKSNGL